MRTFKNNPNLHNKTGDGMVRRFVHQPLIIDHYGIKASIKPNGRVAIASRPVPVSGTDEVEYDEVEIPASLVFKLATLLQATRTVEYVPVAEAAKEIDTLAEREE